MTSTQNHERSVPPDPWLWVLMGLAFLMLAALSIARFLAYNTGMLDLGNMSQAIWSATQGQPLVFTYVNGPTSRLAFHVELIYLLIALPYALIPDPRLLLVLQALLMVAAAIPVYRLTLRQTESRFAARGLVFISLLYPVAQTSVLHDFHGDTLAMPFLLFALDAMDRRAWRSYTIWTILALSSKFYVALPVLLIGLLIWWDHGNRRVGLLTAGGAVIYGLIAFFLIRPFFTTAETTHAHRGFNYFTFYFGELNRIFATWDDRLLHAIIVFGPVLILVWHGWRWLLPGLPVAAAVLISTAPGPAYHYRFHHYALVVPFIIMAAIMGIAHLKKHANLSSRPQRFDWRFMLLVTIMMVLLFNVFLVDTPLSPQFWESAPGRGFDSAAYGITPRDRMKDHFLREDIPPDAPIAASHFLTSRLTNRETLYVVRYPIDTGGNLFPSILPHVDYVLADALCDYRVMMSGGEFAGGAAYEREEIRYVVRDTNFSLVQTRDGMLLFRRDAVTDEVLAIEEPVAVEGAAPPREMIGEEIGLVDAVLREDGRRVAATFEWTALAPLPPAVAVSRLEGVEHSRMVHLPTYVLRPTDTWQPNTHIRETFEVDIPADAPPGRYQWLVGWYDLRHSEAYATDERSRIGDEIVIGEITVGEQLPPLP